MFAVAEAELVLPALLLEGRMAEWALQILGQVQGRELSGAASDVLVL